MTRKSGNSESPEQQRLTEADPEMPELVASDNDWELVEESSDSSIVQSSGGVGINVSAATGASAAAAAKVGIFSSAQTLKPQFSLSITPIKWEQGQTRDEALVPENIKWILIAFKGSTPQQAFKAAREFSLELTNKELTPSITAPNITVEGGQADRSCNVYCANDGARVKVVRYNYLDDRGQEVRRNPRFEEGTAFVRIHHDTYEKLHKIDSKMFPAISTLGWHDWRDCTMPVAVAGPSMRPGPSAIS